MNLVSRHSLLCHDRVDRYRENFCLNKGFDVATELAKARRNYVTIKTICVAIELADRKFYRTRQRWRARAERALDRGAQQRSSVMTDFIQLFYRDRLLTAMLSRHGSSHVAIKNSSCRDSVASMEGLVYRCLVRMENKCARQRALLLTTGPRHAVTAP